MAEKVFTERQERFLLIKWDGFAEEYSPALLKKEFQFHWCIESEWFVKSKPLNRKLTDTASRKWVKICFKSCSCGKKTSLPCRIHFSKYCSGAKEPGLSSTLNLDQSFFSQMKKYHFLLICHYWQHISYSDHLGPRLSLLKSFFCIGFLKGSNMAL